MANKKIVIVGIHPIGSEVHVGSQRMAIELKKQGFDVCYVSSPVSVFHLLLLRIKAVRQKFKRWLAGPSPIEGIIAFTPFYLLPEAPGAPFNWSFAHRLLGKLNHFFAVKTIEKQQFADVDVLIFDSVFQPFWKDYINCKKLIFRVCDNYIGFPGAGEQSIANYQFLLKESDYLACSSNMLFNEMSARFPEKAIYLPNGVDLERFETSSLENHHKLKSSGVKAVYVGTYEEWFDYALMEFLIQKLYQINFVFIGQPSTRLLELKRYKNVEIVGPVAAKHLPNVLRQCDIGLIPFETDKYSALIEYVNPLKLYEYLACGLPVVSTYWEEMALLDSPAVLCKSAEEFLHAVIQVLEEDELDRSHLLDFAKKNNWESRVEDFVKRAF